MRLYHEVAGTSGDEQHLAHRCVHAELGFALTDAGTLPAQDCTLLGQLQHDSGSWGTVIHRIIECSSRAVAEPRGYLRGMSRRQQERQEQARDKKKPGQPRHSHRDPFVLSTTTLEREGADAPGEHGEGNAQEEDTTRHMSMDEPQRIHNTVRLVYDWNYPVGKVSGLLPEQSEAFIDDAAAILMEQHEPLDTCRRRAERAARFAKEFYPREVGHKHAEHILDVLRQHIEAVQARELAHETASNTSGAGPALFNDLAVAQASPLYPAPSAAEDDPERPAMIRPDVWRLLRRSSRLIVVDEPTLSGMQTLAPDDA